MVEHLWLQSEQESPEMEEVFVVGEPVSVFAKFFICKSLLRSFALIEDH